MGQPRQKGFSLVELMVAMVIGLVILLGAITIYISAQGNFQRVQALGDIQSSLLFASDSLLDDLRRAEEVAIDNDNSAVRYQLQFADGQSHTYYFGGDDNQLQSLYVEINGGSSEVIATDLLNEPLLTQVGQPAEGAWDINLAFSDEEQTRRHQVRVVQRNAAVLKSSSP